MDKGIVVILINYLNRTNVFAWLYRVAYNNGSPKNGGIAYGKPIGIRSSEQVGFTEYCLLVIVYYLHR